MSLSLDIDNYRWDIDFFPRGVRYGKAQIINVYNYNTNFAPSLEIPEVLLRTVRLSVTCKSSLETDQRFMVSHRRPQFGPQIFLIFFFEKHFLWKRHFLMEKTPFQWKRHFYMENQIFNEKNIFFPYSAIIQVCVLITGVQNNIKHVRTVHVSTSYFSKNNPTLNLDNLLPYDELELSTIKLSPHLIGKERNTLSLQVVIVPMGMYACTDTVPFDF